jgi:predicted transcriptional regulator
MGIITERDLLKRVVAEARDANKTKVKDVMSSPLVVVEPSMDLEEAVKLMFQMKIKKLPVVDGKRLVGLVSINRHSPFPASNDKDTETTCHETSCAKKHEKSHRLLRCLKIKQVKLYFANFFKKKVK